MVIDRIHMNARKIYDFPISHKREKLFDLTLSILKTTISCEVTNNRIVEISL